MEKFLLKSKNRITENMGSISIHHCYDREKYNIPLANYFTNLVSVKDCEIEPNMGILPHRHKNMELITIPIEGTLVQKNNLGETHFLTPGNIQVMSAGTGISHFEYNKSTDTTLNCIQFSINPNIYYTKPKSHIFPIEINKKGFQKIIPFQTNEFNNNPKLENLHLYYCFFGRNTEKKYVLNNNKKGVLILNISGKISVNDEVLEKRDTLLLRNISELVISSKKVSKFFLFEI